MCQLENASERPGDEPSEQKDSLNERDVNAIEMDFNFDGHFEDVPDNNGDNPDINEEEEPEEDLNEKMGDLGNDTGEILDKDIWAPEEEEKVQLKWCHSVCMCTYVCVCRMRMNYRKSRMLKLKDQI